MNKYLSTREAAFALGVSESSLKRWCDEGKISSSKTAGGHRRILLSDLVAFGEAHGRAIDSIDPLVFPQDRMNLDFLEQSLLNGDTERVDALLSRVFSQSSRRMAAMGDEWIGPVMHRIGEAWSSGRIPIYCEHRAVQLVTHALSTLEPLLKRPSADAPLAIGSTPQGDPYTLPSYLVRLTLKQNGWRVSFLGPNSPIETLQEAIVDLKPQLFWLSVTHFTSEDEIIDICNALSTLCYAQGALFVVGGQAINANLRPRLPRCICCDTLSQLEMIALIRANGAQAQRS